MSGATMVLSAGWLVSPGGAAAVLPVDCRLVELAQLAASHGAGVVLVHDAGALSVPLPGLEDDAVSVTGDDGGRVWRVRVQVGAARVSIVFLRDDLSRHAGPWYGLSARQLVSALGAFERVVGVPWGDSVGHTAESLILSTHPREKGGTLLDREPVTPAPCEGGGLEMAWQSWRRDLTTAEAELTRSGGTVHVFDANAQYLAAWGSAEVGHGTPAHHRSPAFDPRMAGFWRLPGLDSVPPFGSGELLPEPWIRGREWYSTPTVVRMLEVCAGMDVPAPVEAWVWPRRSRFLRGAAERLRDARKAATDELGRLRGVLAADVVPDGVDVAIERVVTADVVLEAIKSLYRIETGRFNQAGRAAASPWRRPDWGHTVRATARVNLHRRLCKLGAAPMGIATDALVFVDMEPDPDVFALRVGLPVGDGLGAFHHVRSAPASAVADELAGASVLDVLDVLAEVAP